MFIIPSGYVFGSSTFLLLRGIRRKVSGASNFGFKRVLRFRDCRISQLRVIGSRFAEASSGLGRIDLSLGRSPPSLTGGDLRGRNRIPQSCSPLSAVCPLKPLLFGRSPLSLTVLRRRRSAPLLEQPRGELKVLGPTQSTQASGSSALTRGQSWNAPRRSYVRDLIN